MRLAPTLVLHFLATVLLPFVSAHARPGGSLHSSQSRSLSRLQYHHPRDLIDVCIKIPGLVVDLLGLIGLDVDLCLCLKDLDLYLKLNLNATTGDSTLAAVNALIGDSDPQDKKCYVLPPHATRDCSNEDPCAFTCDPGYTLSPDGTKCVCASCPSAAARSLRSRRAELSTYAEAKAYCGKAEVCGVPNSTSDNPKKKWECVDVTTSPDSCGGCVYDHSFTEAKGPRGFDCGKGGSCQNGKCAPSVSPVAPVRVPAGHKSHRALLGGLLGGSDPLGGLLGGVGSTVTGLVGGLTGSNAVDKLTGLLTGGMSGPPPGGCDAPSAKNALVSINAVVGNPTIATVNALIGQLTGLEAACGGGAGGGLLDGLLSGLNDILNALPGASDDKCLKVSVCELLHADVCGTLGAALQNLLQSLVNSLGLNEMCPGASSPPPSAAASSDAAPSPTPSPAATPSPSVAAPPVATPSVSPSPSAAASSDAVSPSSSAAASSDAASPSSSAAASSDAAPSPTASSAAPSSSPSATTAGGAGDCDASSALVSIKALVGSNPIIANVNVVIGQLTALKTACGGGGGSGLLDGLLSGLNDILNALPGASDDKCLKVSVCELLHADVCGTLGAILQKLLQNLVDTLGLDAVCPGASSLQSGPVSDASSGSGAPGGLDISLKRHAFRTRSGHLAQADMSPIL
ncbi:hypothetical protein K438DRAFT_1758472 [Mycena galopus ATCC 62051]|nr:hypothetical protein K438DRAFT_1758472 [Mycena galopus ATCC 62051]